MPQQLDRQLFEQLLKRHQESLLPKISEEEQDKIALEAQSKLSPHQRMGGNLLNSGIGAVRGLFGFGDDSKASRFGEMIGAALPFAGAIGMAASKGGRPSFAALRKKLMENALKEHNFGPTALPPESASTADELFKIGGGGDVTSSLKQQGPSIDWDGLLATYNKGRAGENLPQLSHESFVRELQRDHGIKFRSPAPEPGPINVFDPDAHYTAIPKNPPGKTRTSEAQIRSVFDQSQNDFGASGFEIVANPRSQSREAFGYTKPQVDDSVAPLGAMDPATRRSFVEGEKQTREFLSPGQHRNTHRYVVTVDTPNGPVLEPVHAKSLAEAKAAAAQFGNVISVKEARFTGTPEYVPLPKK